ncbi:MAG: hypothetical protein II722_04800, partial [Ruminococcus sp.]|nr:hypothetical protein [Ruminococcus sp.]
MTFKKRVFTAAAAAVFAVSVMPFAAFADDEPAAFEKKAVTTYLYSMEKSEQFECLFSSKLPDVPYIDFEAYADRIYTEDFKTTANGDVYTIKGNNMTFVADTAKDTLTVDGFDLNFDANVVVVEQSTVSDYACNTGDSMKGEKKTAVLDLSKYGIDIVGEDGKLYFPLTTLSDLFSPTYLAAEYVGGNLYFLKTLMASQDDDGYFDRTPIFQQTERSQAMADYTYNELCFLMDNIYGKPPKCALAASIAEKGFDKTLDTYSDLSRKAKKYLLSTSRAKFYMGVTLLSDMMGDGGHTIFLAGFGMDKFGESADFSDTPLMKAFGDIMDEDPDVVDIMAKLIMSPDVSDDVKEARKAKLKGAKLVKQWDDKAAFYVKGETAFFTFDLFENSVVKDFKWSLDYAAQKGLKNFVIDLSANGGGDEDVAHYINAIIANKKNKSNVYNSLLRSSMTGNVFEEEYTLDLDLDGKFDDADKNVCYDFNFAVLTSQVSFSCGNLTPCIAQQDGILVLGETSGGGCCMVTKNYFADSENFSLSNVKTLLRQDLTDVDSGAKVVYDLTKKAADGSTDYSGLYDFDKLEECINEFYGVKPAESSSQPPESSSQPQSSQAAYDGPPLTGHTGAAASVAI